MSFELSSQTAQIFTGVAGIVTGIGQFLGSREETQVGEINAQIFEQRAQAERESQKLLEVQKRKLIRSQIGAQVAVTAGSGFKFTGDPITIMQESLSNAEFDIAIDQYNSEVVARGFETEGRLERFQASQRASLQGLQSGITFLSAAATFADTLGGKKETLGGQPKPPTTKIK